MRQLCQRAVVAVRLCVAVLAVSATSLPAQLSSQPAAHFRGAGAEATLVLPAFVPLIVGGPVRDCPSGLSPADTMLEICRRRSAVSAAEVLSRVEAGEHVWQEGRALTFAWSIPARSVAISGSLNLPLSPVPGTELWVLSVQVGALDRAIISYEFVAGSAGRDSSLLLGEWRGPRAAHRARHTAGLRGTFVHDTIRSAVLGEPRVIGVYTPPGQGALEGVVYIADGQWMHELIPYIDTLIAERRAPRVMLVGVHAAAVDSAGPLERNARALEYLLGFGVDDSRFEAHERFFVAEVLPFVEQKYAAPARRSQRAVFGLSNGASFSAAMALRHSDLFSRAVSFSPAGGNFYLKQRLEGGQRPSFLVLAGALEPDVHERAMDMAAVFRARNLPVTLAVDVGGHDMSLWQQHFATAMVWAASGKYRPSLAIADRD